jgi:hypothetical protein
MCVLNARLSSAQWNPTEPVCVVLLCTWTRLNPCRTNCYFVWLQVGHGWNKSKSMTTQRLQYRYHSQSRSHLENAEIYVSIITPIQSLIYIIRINALEYHGRIVWHLPVILIPNITYENFECSLELNHDKACFQLFSYPYYPNNSIKLC